MQKLTLLMIVAVTTFDFLVKGDKWGRWAILPGGSQYLPELLSVFALIAVVVLGVRSRFANVAPKYWIIFGTTLLIIACGIIANTVASGPVFAGLRNYLRAIPWFFVPAVFMFTEEHLRTQLKLLLLIGILQIPFAVEQMVRTLARGSHAFTGDWIVGTLMLSHTLSIFLVSGICVAAALVARQKIRPRHFVVFFLLLLFPTTINETKATFLLLPLGLFATFLSAASPARRMRTLASAVAVVALFAAVFIPTYDYIRKDRPYSVPITEFLTDSERMERYLWTKEGVGTVREVGRIASIVVAWEQVASGPTSLAFGYGIGNVSDSALGKGFVGRYFNVLGPFAKISLSLILLELGLIGLVLVLALMWQIASDSRTVARRTDGVVGALAAGWVGVTLIMVAATLYIPVIAQSSLSYLFWFFSGVVAAECSLLRSRPSGRRV
jgi:hypothetical protein